MIDTHVLNRGPIGRLQPCRPFVTQRTLIGGPAHQTRNGSDLCEIPCHCN
jgi:hypothetical protein